MSPIRLAFIFTLLLSSLTLGSDFEQGKQSPRAGNVILRKTLIQ
jgi:hypothetical protein